MINHTLTELALYLTIVSSQNNHTEDMKTFQNNVLLSIQGDKYMCADCDLGVLQIAGESKPLERLSNNNLSNTF